MILSRMRTKVVAASLALGALLLVIVTLVLRGDPLGYRGRQAVIHGSVGASEVRAADARPVRGKPGTSIWHDTEIRTSSYSAITLAAPGGTIKVLDRSSLRTRRQDDASVPEWRLLSGRLELEIDAGDGLTVGTQTSTSYVQLLPGSFVLTADGKDLLVGTCLQGSLVIHEGGDQPTELRTGQYFVMAPMAPVFVSDSVPPLELETRLIPARKRAERATVEGQVTPGSRVYVNGEIIFPNSSGAFTAPLAPSARQAVVIAEDLLGHTVQQSLSPRGPSPQP